FGDGGDLLLRLRMDHLSELGRLQGRHHLKPPMAIGEVDRQVLAAAPLPGGVPNQAAYELIAGRDVGDDIGRGPSLAQSSVAPTASGQRIDRLQVPVARLGEPAWLSFHGDYLTVAEGSRAPRLLADSRGPRPV